MKTRLAILVGAMALGACGTEVTVVKGDGGSGASSAGGSVNTGGSNTGGSNTGGSTNTGGNNNGGSGGAAVNCLDAKTGDPCATPGDSCSTYNAATGEYCDAYCNQSLHWEKYCYEEPTYCYDPPALCPGTVPDDGTFCPTTSECEYYECSYDNACGGSGYAYASCEGGYWYAYEDCYCYNPSNLCPSTMPDDGDACSTTAACNYYDCEIANACGDGVTHYAYCQYDTWYTDGGCSGSSSSSSGAGGGI